jgi:hypothetical protein
MRRAFRNTLITFGFAALSMAARAQTGAPAKDTAKAPMQNVNTKEDLENSALLRDSALTRLANFTGDWQKHDPHTNTYTIALKPEFPKKTEKVSFVRFVSEVKEKKKTRHALISESVTFESGTRKGSLHYSATGDRFTTDHALISVDYEDTKTGERWSAKDGDLVSEQSFFNSPKYRNSYRDKVEELAIIGAALSGGADKALDVIHLDFGYKALRGSQKQLDHIKELQKRASDSAIAADEAEFYKHYDKELDQNGSNQWKRVGKPEYNKDDNTYTIRYMNVYESKNNPTEYHVVNSVTREWHIEKYSKDDRITQERFQLVKKIGGKTPSPDEESEEYNLTAFYIDSKTAIFEQNHTRHTKQGDRQLFERKDPQKLSKVEKWIHAFRNGMFPIVDNSPVGERPRFDNTGAVIRQLEME